jgi:carboxypeptidase family protein
LGTLSLVVLGACGPRSHPASPESPASAAALSSLVGVVEDSATGTRLGGAPVFLTDDTVLRPGAPARWSRGGITDRAGRFALREIRPGAHFLYARSIGFHPRWLRVTVPQPHGELVTLRLPPAVIRTGFYPSDSAEAAKNRERMSEWTCQTSDPDAIEATRKAWIETLSSREEASWDSTLDSLGLPRDSAKIARLVRHVTDPEVCRRAGHAYDQMIGATGIYFLVLEAGPILIVADGRGDATLLVDREYRVLTAFVVP